MAEEIKGKGFVVKDKRTFSETGEVRREDRGAEAGEKREEKKEAAGEKRQKEEQYFPEVNFSNFVVSLSTSAMYHFGDFPDPVSKKAERNLAAAKQTIDILGMIQEKTRGNLNEDEKKLMDGILYELRMRYVKEKDRQ
ncbi:MAG: DUF1844 domain-containing protein [Syntrophales bacterium]